MPAADDDLSVRARSRVGAVLCNKYRLDGLLGVGGMATVYAATHLRNANRVAVKILHRELSLDAGLRARFLREGYAANTVGHRGTVRVLDDEAAEDGSVFIVMDLLDGETLDARWERSGRHLGAREVVRLMAELLDVLVAAHAKGIVHRDLKPENLFVTRDGQLKVLDFGVARIREGSPTQTRTGAVFGTPAFMPPEQALGRTSEVDAQTDVWAVGATAFTLLAGRFVHQGQTAEEMLVLSATQPAALLRTVATDVPPVVAHVVDRALAFRKADRWPDARTMHEALVAAEEAIRVGGGDEVEPDEEEDKTHLGPAPAMPSRHTIASTVPQRLAVATVEQPPVTVASTVSGVEAQPVAARPRSTVPARALAAGGLGIGVAVALAVALTNPTRSVPVAAEGAANGISAAGIPEASVVASHEAPPPRPPVIAVEALPIAQPLAVQAATVSRTVVSAPVATVPTPRPTPAPSVSSRPSAPPLTHKRDPLAP